MKELELDFSGERERERKVYKVSELAKEIKSTLQKRFFDVWVEGELTDFKRSSAGHLYMRLKDEGAQIKAVMFRNKAIFLRFKPQDGLAVVARGSVSTYPPSSEYEVILDYLERKGVGELQRAFEEMKARLQEEGLFDLDKKKPIPKFPKAIGVVTSPTGAAIRDILNVTRRRFCSAHVLLYPVQVQGQLAAGQIANAIAEMNRLALVDVLIVGRGGGSAQDLWAFNEEVVARAIYASEIPVISAVGHEVDFTISDYVADLRAPTPSAAAELVVQSQAELMKRADAFKRQLVQMVHQKLALTKQRIQATKTSLRLNSPERTIETSIQRLDEIHSRMHRGVISAIQRTEANVSHLTRRLVTLAPTQRIGSELSKVDAIGNRLTAAMNSRLKLAVAGHAAMHERLVSLMPQNVIKRGYAICQDSSSGKIVSRTRHTQVGANLIVSLHDGSLSCEVEDISRAFGEDGTS